MKKKLSRNACSIVIAFSSVNLATASPTLQGQPGYINMPNANVDPDGTVSFGYSYDSPYGTTWLSTALLPFLQVSGRYVAINGIAGFSRDPGEYGSAYGRFKDKVFDGKLQLLQETDLFPAIAVGKSDLLGTQLFSGHYIVMSKWLGSARNVQVSLGYGNRRPNGVFAGARWYSTEMPGLSLSAEYDANDYAKDFAASKTDAGTRKKGPVIAAEYRWGWLGAQVARHRDHFSANAYISIPFSEREFIPKLYEPAPFDPKKAPAKVSVAEWQQDGSRGAALAQIRTAQQGSIRSSSNSRWNSTQG